MSIMLLKGLRQVSCLYFSDIDLVICGKWAEMPLRTLERALLGRNIPKRDSLMVLDKAAVSGHL